METSTIAAIVGASAAAGALIVTIVKNFTEWNSKIRDRKSRANMLRRNEQGPFDSETIESATRHYIRPRCSNVDPSHEVELRRAAGVTSSLLFQTVDEFLEKDSGYRHLLVLAESGIGKTSFVINYYIYNRSKPANRRHQVKLISLGIPGAIEEIASVKSPSTTVLFLDAFDEDTKAIADHRERLLDLMEAARDFRRVILTCRTQFFAQDEEIPVETGIARIGARRAGEPAVHEFRKLYLMPFDGSDIESYIRRRFPFWDRKRRAQARMIVQAIPNLSVRPMLLAYMPDLLAQGLWALSSSELYEAMVKAWLSRENRWANKTELLRFSMKLAADIYEMRESRGMERIPSEELAGLAQKWGIQLKPWIMRGRSLLNRDAAGQLKFAHRSIMEYLYVQSLLQGKTARKDLPLTDRMVDFLIEAAYGFVSRRAHDWLHAGILSGGIRPEIVSEVEFVSLVSSTFKPPAGGPWYPTNVPDDFYQWNCGVLMPGVMNWAVLLHLADDEAERDMSPEQLYQSADLLDQGFLTALLTYGRARRPNADSITYAREVVSKALRPNILSSLLKQLLPEHEIPISDPVLVQSQVKSSSTCQYIWCERNSIPAQTLVAYAPSAQRSQLADELIPDLLARIEGTSEYIRELIQSSEHAELLFYPPKRGSSALQWLVRTH